MSGLFPKTIRKQSLSNNQKDESNLQWNFEEEQCLPMMDPSEIERATTRVGTPSAHFKEEKKQRQPRPPNGGI
jgi:hypothetical protein